MNIMLIYEIATNSLSHNVIGLILSVVVLVIKKSINHIIEKVIYYLFGRCNTVLPVTLRNICSAECITLSEE